LWAEPPSAAIGGLAFACVGAWTVASFASYGSVACPPPIQEQRQLLSISLGGILARIIPTVYSSTTIQCLEKPIDGIWKCAMENNNWRNVSEARNTRLAPIHVGFGVGTIRPLGLQAQSSAGRKSQANFLVCPAKPWARRGATTSARLTPFNQLEMWQAATFDPATHRTPELGLGPKGFGHEYDAKYSSHGSALGKRIAAGPLGRGIDLFLRIADKHHIHPIFVLVDSWLGRR